MITFFSVQSECLCTKNDKKVFSKTTINELIRIERSFCRMLHTFKYISFSAYSLICEFTLLTAERLRDFHVAVGDDISSHDSFDPGNFTDCLHVPGALAPAENRVLRCDRPVRGRYVAVYMNRTDVSSLCEVEIYGLLVKGSVK